jgi:S1-C subfamily serine protease
MKKAPSTLRCGNRLLPLTHFPTLPLTAALLLSQALFQRVPCCLADDLADKARAVFKANQHAVVTVQLTLKNKFSMPGAGGQSSESRQDVTGTVLDPSGLTVLSLSATDPSQLLQNIVAGGADEESRFKMDTELSDVKILLDDGTEVPAEVVLRDRDLDLAFIRPKAKPSVPMAALDLTKSGKAQVLDEVIALNRLGSAAGRAYSAGLVRITAVVPRPRLFYVPDASLATASLGAPALTLDGKVLGIFVMRSTKARSSASFGMFSLQPENLTGIIVPAEDILKAARQVPEPAGEKAKK